MRYFVLALAFLAGPAFADAFTDAHQIFLKASAGQEKEVQPAIDAFQALARAEPRNPVYAAYLGSAMTLRGRDATMPWNKTKYTEEGLDQLDKALATIKPDNERALLRGVPMGLEARLAAANTFLRVPDGIFHRRAQAKKLVAEIQKHPAYDGAPEGFRKAVQAAAAEAAK